LRTFAAFGCFQKSDILSILFIGQVRVNQRGYQGSIIFRKVMMFLRWIVCRL